MDSVLRQMFTARKRIIAGAALTALFFAVLMVGPNISLHGRLICAGGIALCGWLVLSFYSWVNISDDGCMLRVRRYALSHFGVRTLSLAAPCQVRIEGDDPEGWTPGQGHYPGQWRIDFPETGFLTLDDWQVVGFWTVVADLAEVAAARPDFVYDADTAAILGTADPVDTDPETADLDPDAACAFGEDDLYGEDLADDELDPNDGKS